MTLNLFLIVAWLFSQRNLHTQNHVHSTPPEVNQPRLLLVVFIFNSAVFFLCSRVLPLCLPFQVAARIVARCVVFICSPPHNYIFCTRKRKTNTNGRFNYLAHRRGAPAWEVLCLVFAWMSSAHDQFYGFVALRAEKKHHAISRNFHRPLVFTSWRRIRAAK